MTLNDNSTQWKSRRPNDDDGDTDTHMFMPLLCGAFDYDYD